MNKIIPPTIILIPKKFDGILNNEDMYTKIRMARVMKKSPPKVMAQGTTFRGKHWSMRIYTIPKRTLIQREFHIAS